VKIGSLFAGIGGFDLAAHWMGWETAWFSEIDPYASAVLAQHWPGVPNHGDITRIDFTKVEPVDLLCGGFPCQDVSRASAGRRLMLDGPKSGLWRDYVRAFRDLRPRYGVVENSPEILVGGLGGILRDLAELGYDAEWSVLSAYGVGAYHIRERLFLLAHPSGRRPGAPQEALFAGRQGAELRPRWLDEPAVGRVANGLPARVDRARRRCLGNAIVPQCALVIFRAIQAHEANMRAAA
jgi:DNA (cytosine-5)-methyltransferase 1